MHIVRFEAQNIKRLSAVSIDAADSSAVVLAGENEAGKSSVIDAIEMALAGERAQPPEPIRRGREKAYVIVDLGDIIVTRRFTSKGSSLVIENRDGLRYKSPQAVLDGFYSKLTFDPLAFAHAKPEEQARILRQLAGLDTKDLDDARAKAFEARTLVNRDVARAKGALDKAEHYPDVIEAKDAGALLAQLANADRIAKVVAEANTQVLAAQSALHRVDDRVARANVAVASAQRALEAAEREQSDAFKARENAAAVFSECEAELAQARQVVPDTAGLRSELAAAQDHNRKVDANGRRAALAQELDNYQTQAATFTQAIEDLDAAKAERLAAAKFPVDGLGVSDAGVTWNGIPFEQASTAIRTRVSAAIGFALNPKLNILLIRNGNDLDAKNLQLLAEAAKEAGGQIWVERIAGGVDGLQTVVIEDGAVQGATLPDPAADEPQRLDARAHAGDGPTADAEAMPRPRKRAAAGLFEESAAK